MCEVPKNSTKCCVWDFVPMILKKCKWTIFCECYSGECIVWLTACLSVWRGVLKLVWAKVWIRFPYTFQLIWHWHLTIEHLHGRRPDGQLRFFIRGFGSAMINFFNDYLNWWFGFLVTGFLIVGFTLVNKINHHLQSSYFLDEDLRFQL